MKTLKEFLVTNKRSFKNKDDAYDKALILLKDRKAIGHTNSIIEWLIAHNLFVRKVNIPNYSIYEIDNMSQNEINQLAKLLTMNGNNSENIKNILRYLHKLNDIELDIDINQTILQNLDDLELSEINFETLRFNDSIDLLETHRNKALIRKMIYNNMDKIIFYMIFNVEYEKLRSLKYIYDLSYQFPRNIILELIKNNEKRILKNHTIEEINDLINSLDESDDNEEVPIGRGITSLVNYMINLIKIDEIGLAKQVFDISNKYKFTVLINRVKKFFSEYLVEYLIYNPNINVNIFNILLNFIGETNFIINLGDVFRRTMFLKPDYIKGLINKLIILEKYNLIEIVVNNLATNNYEGGGDVYRLLLPLTKKAIEIKDYDLLTKYLKIVDLAVDKKLKNSTTRSLNIDDLMRLNNIS